MPDYQEEPNDLSGIVNKHLIYEYSGLGYYELWVKTENRVVYKIHGGPMQGRDNFQECQIRRIRDDIFMISWLEETGTIVTVVADLTSERVHSNINFSKGHWENPEDAHGHYAKDRWRKLAEVNAAKGETLTTGRHIVSESARITKVSEGKGDLEDIDLEAPTL